MNLKADEPAANADDQGGVFLASHAAANLTHRQPVDFSNEVDPASVGMRAEDIKKLAAQFERQHRRRWHSAAQLVVLRHGSVVLDRAIGTLGESSDHPIDKETPFMVFSSTKAFTGMAVHKLIEEGKLEWDAPIAGYWPAWGRGGKEKATLRQVLCHMSGIGQPHLTAQAFLWPCWKLVTLDIALTRAEFEPGTACAYQTVNFGFILGEVIRRVTGMPAGEYIRRALFEPLGLRNSFLPIDSVNLRRSPRLAAGGKSFAKAVRVFNLPIIRTALMPGATLHAPARDLAVFYQMLLNGGDYNGQRLFQPGTIARAVAPGYHGYDRTVKGESFWAHGFHLGGEARSDRQNGKGSSESTFAHYGMGTCMAWADWREQVVVAFTCNKLLEPPGPEARWKALNTLVWDALS